MDVVQVIIINLDQVRSSIKKQFIQFPPNIIIYFCWKQSIDMWRLKSNKIHWFGSL